MNNNKDNRVKERVVAWSSSQKSLSARVKNKMKTLKTLTMGLALAALALTPSAGATLVSYDVAGWGPTSFPFNNGYPGDTVELTALTGASIDLAPGVAKEGKINGLLWTVNYSGGPGQPGNADFTLNLARNMTMTAGGQNVIQTGLLNVRSAADTLSLLAGSPIVFHFTGYDVQVTPLAGGPWTKENLGTYDYDVNASFLLTAVPEPTTMIAGALLLLPFGASTLRMLRKNRAA